MSQHALLHKDMPTNRNYKNQQSSNEFLLERIHYTRKRPDNLKETASIPTSVYQLSA